MQWLHHSPGGFCQPQRLSGPGACLGHWTCGDIQSELLPGSTRKGTGVVYKSWPGPHPSEPHLLQWWITGQTLLKQWAQHFTVYVDLLYYQQVETQREQLNLSQEQCGFPDISEFCWVKTVMSSIFQNMRSQDLSMRQDLIM